jgi:hypothetical protein
MNTITLAKINEVSIQLVTDNSRKLVPIRPICEALGIDYAAQFSKLKEDDFLSSTVVLSPTVGADGKDREMVCLPLEFIFGWIFTINPKNVKPEAREAVAKYRIECYHALFRYFSAQSEFLVAKQEVINERIEEYEKIRSDFKAAEKRLKEAKAELYKAKDYTFEEWEFNNRQLVLFPQEGENDNG